jgi:hypothetical protein
MYPLHSHWTAEQAMDRPYDPDRLDRGPVYAHRASRSVGSGTLPRLTAAVTSLRAATEIWIRRGSLGPLPDRRAGDPFGQGR